MYDPEPMNNINIKETDGRHYFITPASKTGIA